MGKHSHQISKAHVGLERPHFGQFVRQVASIKTSDLEKCLQHQQEHGGRLGDILVSRGLLDRQQVLAVLRRQAAWVAASRQADVSPVSFPYPSSLSLCMPAYNEAANIESTLEAACEVLPQFIEDFEIVVVNDGSRDATGEIVDRCSRRDSRVRLVNHEHNRGYGAAVSSALRAARCELIMFTDSDGQFSMLDVPQLLAQLDGHDMVIGYRHQRADVGIRKLNAWSWNQLIRLMLGVRVRDLDCAFKLFRREVVDRLELTATGACINAEILVQCVRSNLKICEIPVMHYPRYHGAPTGANFKVIAKAFRELPQLWRYRSTPARPIPFVPVAIEDGALEESTVA